MTSSFTFNEVTTTSTSFLSSFLSSSSSDEHISASQKTISMICAIANPITYGFVNTIDKTIVSRRVHHTPSYVALVGVVDALIGIGFLCFGDWSSSRLSKLKWTDYFYPIMSGICCGMSSLLYFFAMEWAEASTVVGIEAAYPLFVVIWSLIFLSEKIPGLSYGGIAFSIVGGVILSIDGLKIIYGAILKHFECCGVRREKFFEEEKRKEEAAKKEEQEKMVNKDYGDCWWPFKDKCVNQDGDGKTAPEGEEVDDEEDNNNGKSIEMKSKIDSKYEKGGRKDKKSNSKDKKDKKSSGGKKVNGDNKNKKSDDDDEDDDTAAADDEGDETGEAVSERMSIDFMAPSSKSKSKSKSGKKSVPASPSKKKDISQQDKKNKRREEDNSYSDDDDDEDNNIVEKPRAHKKHHKKHHAKQGSFEEMDDDYEDTKQSKKRKKSQKAIVEEEEEDDEDLSPVPSDSSSSSSSDSDSSPDDETSNSKQNSKKHSKNAENINDDDEDDSSSSDDEEEDNIQDGSDSDSTESSSSSSSSSSDSETSDSENESTTATKRKETPKKKYHKKTDKNQSKTSQNTKNDKTKNIKNTNKNSKNTSSEDEEDDDDTDNDSNVSIDIADTDGDKDKQKEAMSRSKKIRKIVFGLLPLPLLLSGNDFFAKLAVDGLDSNAVTGFNSVGLGFVLFLMIIKSESRKYFLSELKYNVFFCIFNELLTIICNYLMIVGMIGLAAPIVSALSATRPLFVLILETIFRISKVPVSQCFGFKLFPIVCIIGGAILMTVASN